MYTMNHGLHTTIVTLAGNGVIIGLHGVVVDIIVGR